MIEIKLDEHLEKKPSNAIILRSGEIDHLKAIMEALITINHEIHITCIVQKEFEKAASAEKKISEIIIMDKLGDYSFKLSLGSLRIIRKNRFDVAIIMARAGNEIRDRRTHLIAAIIKADRKIVSVSDGSIRNFKLDIPLTNLAEVLLSNIVSLIDFFLAKIAIFFFKPLIPILKFCKKKEFRKK
jgi:hypothetical protein